MSALALWLYVENGDALQPRLHRILDEFSRKFACDNPDTMYWRCVVSPSETFRLTGNRGKSPYTAIAVEADMFTSSGQKRGTLAQHTLDDFEIAPNGDFEITLSAEPKTGNWIELVPGTTKQNPLGWRRAVTNVDDVERYLASGPWSYLLDMQE